MKRKISRLVRMKILVFLPHIYYRSV